MTTRYRVEYALKVAVLLPRKSIIDKLTKTCQTHRRDQLIEWIKGLLAVPFVLHAQPTAVYEERADVLTNMAAIAHKRYSEILRDVEELINDHIKHQLNQTSERSKLKLLVPGVGVFFTPLLLEKAFDHQDKQRRISSRRFVPPSFNDIRLMLNTAQVLGLIKCGPLELITFDGDLTLYPDGHSLTADNPVIPRIIELLRRGTKVAIVTAAGYTDRSKYYGRLYGLLDRVKKHVESGELLDVRLIILGGESSYLFEFEHKADYCLESIDKDRWILPEMKQWTADDVASLLDVAEKALRECISTMNLSAEILRKERAVGIIPTNELGALKFTREQLEETVLVTQQILEMSPVAKQLPFCAFNGGNDVFVDIGDKGWGVMACRNYLGRIDGSKTLHVGDQFLSAGANDFKARLACTTAWIANPAETVQLLDELAAHTAADEFNRRDVILKTLRDAP